MPWFRAHISLLILSLLATLFFLGSASVSLNRHWQYDSGYYDLGIFADGLRSASRLQPPIVDHLTPTSGKWIFADHFSPSIFVLAPVFWIYPGVESLLIAQSAVVALSGVVLFFLARRHLKHDVLALSITSSYFLYAGLQHALWFEFHEVTVLTLPLMLLLTTIITGQKKWFWPLFIFVLGFKESLFVLGCGIAVFIFFYKKEWRKTAVLAFLLSLLYGYGVIQWVIPFFRSELYHYSTPEHLTFLEYLVFVFTPLEKWQTVFWTGLSFAGTLLLVPELWPVVGAHFLLRWHSQASERWGIGLHYNAEIAPIFALAMILATARILPFSPQKYRARLRVFLAVAYCLLALFLFRFVLRGPFAMSYNAALYTHTQNFEYLEKTRAEVPAGAIVMAQNNLAVHLPYNKVWMLTDNYRRYAHDYIWLDNRDGQRSTSYLGIPDIAALEQKIIKSGEYEIVAQHGKSVLFKRIVGE